MKEKFFVGSLCCSPSNSQIEDVPHVLLGSYLGHPVTILTWPAEFLHAIFFTLSLCRFCWITGGTIFREKMVGGSCRHERWQRLIEEPPWVFACIWQNLGHLHTPQARIFHHAKLIYFHLTIKPIAPYLTVGCNPFIQNSSSGHLHTHTRALHESWANEDSREDHGLPKVQWKKPSASFLGFFQGWSPGCVG